MTGDLVGDVLCYGWLALAWLVWFHILARLALVYLAGQK